MGSQVELPAVWHSVRMTLDPVQIRVLGALMEKEIATPENYPLSLNALGNACNQRSSRDPVMELTEEQVRQALHALEDMGLTAAVRDSRVAKYEHRIRTVLNLRRDETAILCLLFLRGPQTPGELRSRSDRLYSFDGLDAVESTLNRLMAPALHADEPSGPPSTTQELRPLVAVLPRRPGSREARYMHLLGGPAIDGQIEVTARTSGHESIRPHDPPTGEAPEPGMARRLSALETEVAELRATIAQMKARMDAALPLSQSRRTSAE
jgi:uncharacterized protein